MEGESRAAPGDVASSHVKTQATKCSDERTGCCLGELAPGGALAARNLKASWQALPFGGTCLNLARRSTVNLFLIGEMPSR
eukprot:5819259-Pyramimonas_sp.AAC.1